MGLSDLVWDGPFHGSADARVDRIFDMIQEAYDALGVTTRLSTLKLSMLSKRQGSPWASFSNKAAECRDFLEPLLRVCERVHNVSDRDHARVRCLQSICSIERLLKRSGMVLSGDGYARVKALATEHFVFYNYLVRNS